VWAFSELLIALMASAAAYELAREQAEAVKTRRCFSPPRSAAASA
jgi:hypothetical protein